jgi:hypothetical protein
MYVPLAMPILQLLSDGLLRLKEIEAYTAHDKPSSNEMVVSSGATKDEHATTVPESASTGRQNFQVQDMIGKRIWCMSDIFLMPF